MKGTAMQKLVLGTMIIGFYREQNISNEVIEKPKNFLNSLGVRSI